MEKSEKTEALLSYLHKKYVLCRDHHDDEECREFLIEHSDGEHEVKGFGCAIGSVNDRLVDLINNPDNWKIVDFSMALRKYPFPWSVGHEKYKFISFLNW